MRDVLSVRTVCEMLTGVWTLINGSRSLGVRDLLKGCWTDGHFVQVTSAICPAALSSRLHFTSSSDGGGSVFGATMA